MVRPPYSSRIKMLPGPSWRFLCEHLNISWNKEKNKIFNFSRILKYSVAACLIGLLGLTLFNMNHKRITDPVNGLTTVSDQDMANYLDNHDIHWTPGITSSSETASVDFSDNDIHELFSNVSDDELEQYIPSLPLNKGSVN